MSMDSLPFFVPLTGFAATAICCAISALCSTRRTRQQTEALHQRLLALEQAPPKVVVQGPAPVYYQPPITIVTTPPSQPKPSAPAGQPSYYPPYSTAYQGQTYPITR